MEVITLSTNLKLNGIEFNYLTERNFPLISDSKIKHALIYESTEDNSDLAVILLGYQNERLVELERKQVKKPLMLESDVTKIKQEYDQRIIGSTVPVILLGFNQDNPINAKVDTGAGMCCLDARNIKFRTDSLDESNSSVSFSFQGVEYTMACEGKTSVQTADGGVKYRPIVMFTVKLEDGRLFKNIFFTLNDREDMEFPILLGVNFLEVGRFLIDPLKESINWEQLDNLLTSDASSIPEPTAVKIQNVLAAFENEMQKILQPGQ